MWFCGSCVYVCVCVGVIEPVASDVSCVPSLASLATLSHRILKPRPCVPDPTPTATAAPTASRTRTPKAPTPSRTRTGTVLPTSSPALSVTPSQSETASESASPPAPNLCDAVADPSLPDSDGDGVADACDNCTWGGYQAVLVCCASEGCGGVIWTKLVRHAGCEMLGGAG